MSVGSDPGLAALVKSFFSREGESSMTTRLILQLLARNLDLTAAKHKTSTTGSYDIGYRDGLKAAAAELRRAADTLDEDRDG